MFSNDPQKDKLSFSVMIIIEKDGDEYHAFCPALKGLHTCGATEQEALSNAKNAFKAHIDSSIKHGDPIPLCQPERPKRNAHPYIYERKLIEETI